MSEFKDSLSKLAEEYKDNPEGWEKVKKFAEKIYLERSEKDLGKVTKKYGPSLVKDAVEYVDDNYSQVKASKMSVEEKIIAYMESNPKDIDTKDLKGVLGRDKQKPLIHFEIDDALGEPFWNPDTDEIEERKPSRTTYSGRYYGDEEAMKMPLKDLGKIIAEAKGGE
jgi:hypothetical protein